MPILGGLLVSLFSGLAAWLAQWVTRKVAVAGAAVATMTALTAALFLSMRATLATLNGFTTGAPQIFMDMLAMAIPSSAPACIGLYVTMWTACTVYVWQKDLLKLATQAH